MRLADHVSYVLFALIIVMLLALFSPIQAKQPNWVVKATCWSIDFNNKHCKLRTKDEKIYWDGKWHSGYKLVGTTQNDYGLQLMVLKDSK